MQLDAELWESWIRKWKQQKLRKWEMAVFNMLNRGRVVLNLTGWQSSFVCWYYWQYIYCSLFDTLMVMYYDAVVLIAGNFWTV